MRSKRIIAAVLSASLLLVAAPFSSPAQAQQSAALFFSPGSGSYGVGATLTLAIRVDSGGSPGINAAEAQIKFDQAKLQVTSISKSGSIFTLWPSEPAFSNSDGSITFAGGSPSAYSGSSGTIISVGMRTLAAGTAEVSYTSGSVLAADGQGTNVLGESRRAVLTISGSAPTPDPEPSGSGSSGGSSTQRPGAPEIHSPTHPDANQWYSESDVELRWTLPIGVTGTSTEFDTAGDTNPGTRSEGIAENTLFEGVEDGIWWFHLRFLNSAGWGPASHRRVLVDTTPPDAFDVGVEQLSPTDPTPRLLFTANDSLAGIAKYEIRVGANDPITLTPQEVALSGGSTVGPLPPGEHTISVVAYDGALNERVVDKTVTIEPIAVPAITGYSEEVTSEGIFYVQGVGPERGRIIIRLQPVGEGDTIEKEIPTDADGQWFYIDENVPRGSYELIAKAFDTNGAQSNFTDPLPVLVRATPFLVRFGWLIMLIMLLIIIGLVVLLFLERRKHEEERQRIAEEVADLRARLRDVFSALHEEAEEQIRDFDKRPSLSEKEEKILNKIEQALEISEELVGKEIADVEQLMEE